MDSEKRHLIERIARQIMQNPMKWADLIINALEWHLDETFTQQELEDTFGKDMKEGEIYGNN